MSDRTAQEHADTVPRSWIVMWKDVSTTEQLAWFQASRRNGSAPRQGEEVVAAEDYDALLADVERLTAERDEAYVRVAEWEDIAPDELATPGLFRQYVDALEEAKDEAGLILVALGEPCAECGHVDWRADDARIDSYRNALATAKSERDEAYRQAAQADEANVMMGARCRDVEIALATAEALADRRLEALRQASDCCSRPPGVCFDAALARLSAGKETHA